MAAALKLAVTFALGKDQLTLTYEVTNPDRRDAYLLNRLYRTSPAWLMTPDVVYVHFLPESKTVWLNKKLADLPSGVNITAPVAPFVTPLRAGATFREEVHVPVPVREYREYGGELRAARAEEVRQTYERVSFALGYYWRPDGTVEVPQVIQGSPVVMPRTPPGVRLEFGLAQSDPKAMAIPIELRPPPQ